MANQNLLIAALIACSLGGWYVVLNKYFAIRRLLSTRGARAKQVTTTRQEPILHPLEKKVKPELEKPNYAALAYDTNYSNHIPGFGPAPLTNIPFEISPETLDAMRHYSSDPNIAAEDESKSESEFIATQTQQDSISELSQAASVKRQVCNWAAILHVSGLLFVTGVPFLNVILPTFLWLWIKEDHPFLVKHGREVINFQITLSIIMFLCLFLGAFFVWLLPSQAQTLFEWTKTLRIVFSTGMNLPCNIFNVVPFFWGCIMVVRGTVAAYHGVAFRYPLAQPFLFPKLKTKAVNVQTTSA